MKFKAEATKSVSRNCMSRVAADVRRRIPRQNRTLFRLLTSAATNSCSAFTLAEVLAALVFMAILIPVALEGLSIASRAGEVAVRKSEAALLAERILNESVVTTNWNSAVQNGTLRQGVREFRYSLRNEPWVQDPNQSAMRQLSVEGLFTAQSRDYSVKMSTLVDSTSAFSQAQQQQQTGAGQ